MNTYRKNLSHEYNLIDLAELFKVFEDVNRIKILFALIEGEMCVCDIVNLLGMSQSAVSHQLRILKQSRLVRVRKQGKLVYYSLGDNRVRQIFNCGLCHIEEIYNI
ncbi:ArsR/SmtB family transcription factor [Terrisporobacter sp.]